MGRSIDRVARRTPSRVAWPLVAAAAGCLVGGFADLFAGGITLGATLLVAGYVVAVPAALLIERRRSAG